MPLDQFYRQLSRVWERPPPRRGARKHSALQLSTFSRLEHLPCLYISRELSTSAWIKTNPTLHTGQTPHRVDLKGQPLQQIKQAATNPKWPPRPTRSGCGWLLFWPMCWLCPSLRLFWPHTTA
ncbi:hypothetical protein EGW08_014682 [Elysia chlorotica]|uniref:Uncharacterized protein n=1 Tax=Elysia chlorotica TaxID=188477 RepID=A0A3S0ZXB9_ELYCH|nr:hypothetical protein EGW08_014682 [Elysia chlorotica]